MMRKDKLDYSEPMMMPAAPAPVRTPKPTRPQPAQPRPQPRDPFKLPKQPAKKPEPKACLEDRLTEILEGYEEEADPEVVKFWRDLPKGGHAYSKHPILALLGHKLSSEAFGWNSERATKLAASNPHEVHNAFMNIEKLERKSRKELEELAKDIVSQTWNVPKEILDAKLTRNINFNPEQEEAWEEENEQTEEPEQELSKEQPKKPKKLDKVKIRELINKRITMNALTQGAAVHNMMTIHHLAAEKLNKIDPTLTKLYDKFAIGGAHQYAMANMAAMATSLPDMAIGKVYIDPSEPMIYARALNFPVLLQELVKGVMELISMHGLVDIDEETLTKIYNTADNYIDEAHLIHVGPQLWRYVLKAMPKGKKLADVMATLSVTQPKQLHDFLAAAVDEPEKAKTMLAEIIEEDEKAQGLHEPEDEPESGEEQEGEQEYTDKPIRIFVTEDGEIYDQDGDSAGHLYYHTKEYESPEEIAAELSEKLSMDIQFDLEKDGNLEFKLSE